MAAPPNSSISMVASEGRHSFHGNLWRTPTNSPLFPTSTPRPGGLPGWAIGARPKSLEGALREAPFGQAAGQDVVAARDARYKCRNETGSASTSVAGVV